MQQLCKFMLCAQSLSCIRLLWLHGLQPARLLCPWGFSRQEYWSELSCPPPGDLPDPGIKPASLPSLPLAGRLFTTSTTWEAQIHVSDSGSHSVVSNSLWPRGLYSLWNSPGQNTGMGSLFFLQGIFPTQGSNPDCPHCRQILYQLSHKGRT